MPGKISISRANEMDRGEFLSAFGPVYESSPWIAEAALGSRPFSTPDDLHSAMVRAVDAAPEALRMDLILAHPDLAGKAAMAGELTEESAGEQSSAGLDKLTPKEYGDFTRMNRAYRERFGMPMIVCVREHVGKGSILRAAEDRLGNGLEEEVGVALGEIHKIARRRLNDLLEERRTGRDEGERQAMARPETGKIVLGQNNYGKSEIRLVKVKRDAARHELWDVHVRVTLEGDFDAAYYGDDNSQLLATDTMRNTVYALAQDGLTGSIEGFGLVLVDHFLEAGPTVRSCRIEFTQFPWNRIEVDGAGHDHSFVRGRGERRAQVWGDEAGARTVEAGMDDVYVMKTTNSGWERFYRDPYTTLFDADDRILATVITAKWWYSTTDADFDGLYEAVHDQTLKTFTDHYSPSAQHTLYRMGEAVLKAVPLVEKIWYSLPNVHHIAYDLDRFGIENAGEIFHATQDPYGQIEGHVERRF